MPRIAVDAMGGDRGPEAVVEGALAARSDELEPVIFGSAGLDTRGLPLVPTTQVVGMDEKRSTSAGGQSLPSTEAQNGNTAE